MINYNQRLNLPRRADKRDPIPKSSKKSRQKRAQLQSKSTASSSKLISNNDVQSSSDSDISSRSEASSPKTKHSKKSRQKCLQLQSKSTASSSKSKSNKDVESSSDSDLSSSNDASSSSKKSNKKSSNWTDFIYHNAFTPYWRFENPLESQYAKMVGQKIELVLNSLFMPKRQSDGFNREVSSWPKHTQILTLVLRIVWVMIHFLHSLIIINQWFPMVSISVQFLKVIILPCQVIHL